MNDLCIGMLTYDDFYGTYMTIETAKHMFRDLLGSVSFIVVDNNPDGDHGKTLRNYCSSVDYIDYTAVRGVAGSTLKNIVFQLSPATFTMCVDCHVILYEKSLHRLLKFFELYPDSNDLFQGPLVNEADAFVGTEMNPNWSNEMFGQWHTSPELTDLNGPAMEIPMHGCGLMACRTAAWLGFPSSARGFGGEEGIIHEKYRLLGRKCYCLPFLRWQHRFYQVGERSYPLQQEDKIKNHLIGFREIQLDPAPLWDHFRKRIIGKNEDEKQDKLLSYQTFYEMLPPSSLPRRTEAPFLGKPVTVVD